jgi:hypothetical protein
MCMNPLCPLRLMTFHNVQSYRLSNRRFVLSRRERGFDSRWDHHGKSRVFPYFRPLFGCFCPPSLPPTSFKIALLASIFRPAEQRPAATKAAYLGRPDDPPRACRPAGSFDAKPGRGCPPLSTPTGNLLPTTPHFRNSRSEFREATGTRGNSGVVGVTKLIPGGNVKGVQIELGNYSEPNYSPGDGWPRSHA